MPSVMNTGQCVGRHLSLPQSSSSIFLVIASWLLEQAFRVVITADSLGLPDVG